MDCYVIEWVSGPTADAPHPPEAELGKSCRSVVRWNVLGAERQEQKKNENQDLTIRTPCAMRGSRFGVAAENSVGSGAQDKGSRSEIATVSLHSWNSRSYENPLLI